MIRSFPPHPNPLPCLRRSGYAQAGPRGEERPFIPPAELGGILAYFDKDGALLVLSLVTLKEWEPITLSCRRGHVIIIERAHSVMIFEGVTDIKNRYR